MTQSPADVGPRGDEPEYETCLVTGAWWDSEVDSCGGDLMGAWPTNLLVSPAFHWIKWLAWLQYRNQDIWDRSWVGDRRLRQFTGFTPGRVDLGESVWRRKKSCSYLERNRPQFPYLIPVPSAAVLDVHVECLRTQIASVCLRPHLRQTSCCRYLNWTLCWFVTAPCWLLWIDWADKLSMSWGHCVWWRFTA